MCVPISFILCGQQGRAVGYGKWGCVQSVIALINLRVQTCTNLRFLRIYSHSWSVVVWQWLRKLNSCPNNNSISPLLSGYLYSVGDGSMDGPFLGPNIYPCAYHNNIWKGVKLLRWSELSECVLHVGMMIVI